MRRAFSLLEVVVALAVFALGAIVLGAAYVNILKSYEVAQKGNQTDEDVRFARSLLLAEPDHDKAEKGGDFDSGNGRRVSWHATIESTVSADLFQVTFVCDINDPSTGALPTVTESFTVLRPTWADPTVNSKLRQQASDRIKEMQSQRKS